MGSSTVTGLYLPDFLEGGGSGGWVTPFNAGLQAHETWLLNNMLRKSTGEPSCSIEYRGSTHVVTKHDGTESTTNDPLEAINIANNDLPSNGGTIIVKSTGGAVTRIHGVVLNSNVHLRGASYANVITAPAGWTPGEPMLSTSGSHGCVIEGMYLACNGLSSGIFADGQGSGLSDWNLVYNNVVTNPNVYGIQQGTTGGAQYITHNLVYSTGSPGGTYGIQIQGNDAFCWDNNVKASGHAFAAGLAITGAGVSQVWRNHIKAGGYSAPDVLISAGGGPILMGNYLDNIAGPTTPTVMTVASASCTGTVATVVFTGAHPYQVGELVINTGIAVGGYNIIAYITAISGTSISFNVPTSLASAGAGGSTTNAIGCGVLIQPAVGSWVRNWAVSYNWINGVNGNVGTLYGIILDANPGGASPITAGVIAGNQGNGNQGVQALASFIHSQGLGAVNGIVVGPNSMGTATAFMDGSPGPDTILGGNVWSTGGLTSNLMKFVDMLIPAFIRSTVGIGTKNMGGTTPVIGTDLLQSGDFVLGTGKIFVDDAGTLKFVSVGATEPYPKVVAGPITAAVTLDQTAAAVSNICNVSIPANTAYVGQKFKVKCSGALTSTAGVNVVVSVLLGATTLISKAFPVNQVGNWRAEFDITIRVIGGAGTSSIVGMGDIINKMSSTTTAQTDEVGPTVTSPDLTTTLSLALKCNLASGPVTQAVTVEEAEIIQVH